MGLGLKTKPNILHIVIAGSVGCRLRFPSRFPYVLWTGNLIANRNDNMQFSVGHNLKNEIQ